MSSARSDPRPSAFGIAVVFDWALAVQMTAQAIAGAVHRLGLELGPGEVAGRIAAAAVLAVFGELVRRGDNLARRLQVLLCGAISVGGVVLLGRLLAGRSHAGAVFPTLIMITFAPWITWRLLLPRTAAFFSDRDAVRRRTDRRWLVLVLVQSAIWGVAVAVSEAY